MLAAAVSEITSIDIEYFNNGILSRFSIAQKMSWASSRRTTRVEDAAYCMLGIFGINMPLLYGEGEGAFQRLQEEILRRSTDSSIFAWDKTQYVPQLLAPAPSYFRRYGLLSRVDERNFRGLYSKSTIVDRGASVTSKGVEITLPFVTRDAICSKPELARFRLLDKVAILNCGHGDKLAAVGFAHTAAGSIQRQLLGHTAVFMVPKNVVRDAILETVVLQKNPEASTSLWGVTVPTWHDPIEVNFPDLNSVGFSLKMISTKESKSQREWKIDKFPGGVRLNNYEPQNNSAPPTLIFSSGFWPESKADAPADGTRIEQRFSVSMKPTPSSLNMAIETDSGIVEGDSSGDWVSVVQSHRDDKIRLQAKTRRGPRYWIVTISIVSSKENSKRRQSASDSTRGSTRSSRK
jgi:hypothetical protein